MISIGLACHSAAVIYRCTPGCGQRCKLSTTDGFKTVLQPGFKSLFKYDIKVLLCVFFAWVFELHCAEWCMCGFWHLHLLKVGKFLCAHLKCQLKMDNYRHEFLSSLRSWSSCTNLNGLRNSFIFWFKIGRKCFISSLNFLVWIKTMSAAYRLIQLWPSRKVTQQLLVDIECYGGLWGLQLMKYTNGRKLFHIFLPFCAPSQGQKKLFNDGNKLSVAYFSS